MNNGERQPSDHAPRREPAPAGDARKPGAIFIARWGALPGAKIEV